LLSTELRFIAEMAETLTGPAGRKIVELLAIRNEMTDDEIAKILDAPINEVRIILHKLFDARLLKYRRERDKKIGWYVYFWRITDENAEIIYKQRKRKVLEKLKKRLIYETQNTFYACSNRDIPRLTFDDAFNNMFKCPVCGAILEPYDNSEIIIVLKNIIEKIESSDP